jgi:hypothetical protein
MSEFEVTGSGELDLGLPQSAAFEGAALRRALPPDAAETGAGPEWSVDEWVDAGWVPGDYGDPETEPDDEQAWLASLPADVRDEFLAGAWTGDGELIPAGFVHHLQGGPSGAGFAAGGALDTLAPGPWLSEAVAGVAADGHHQLGESELIGVLCAWRRMSSWAAAGEAAAVLALDRRRAVQAGETGRAHLSEHVGDELAAALTLTGRSADRLLSLSRGLGRLEEVHAALERGEIDWAKACVFVDELGVLESDEAAREIAGRLLGRAGAGGWTTGQLRARLRQAVLAADPDAAVRRRRDARADADVESWDESSGNAALAGRELPPAQVIAAMARLTALARWLHDNGAAGTIGQLRAAVYTALLADRPVESLLPGLTRDRREPAAADSKTGEDEPAYGPGAGSPIPDQGSEFASADSIPACGREPAGAGAPASPGEQTSAGEETSAGEPVSAREPTGAIPEPAAQGPYAGPLKTDALGTDPLLSGNSSGWPAISGTVHLTMPMSAWLGGGQPGDVVGHGPVDAPVSRELAALLASNPGTRWCLTVTGPDGRAAGHACASKGPAAGEPVLRWAAGLRARLRLLETWECSHATESPAYRPPAALRHLVCVRQRTCCYPGCRRSAVRCDLDHTVAFDKGGRTCNCNLAPLCRRHHRAKQAPGWHLEQPLPGQMTWRMPSGRSYQTAGDPYPS